MMLRGLVRRLGEIFSGRTVDDEFFDYLEEVLIQADVGLDTTLKLVEGLRERAAREGWRDSEVVEGYLRDALVEILERPEARLRVSSEPPTVILVVGVNGTGKTTTIAKLAYRLKGEGRKVLLAAADTFRAAGIDQLEVWAQRIGVGLVRQQEGSDPGAVVFDAIQAARARGVDFVIADTAGRLHTKRNLMEELKKIGRVTERALGRPADEVLLVLDATTGHNAVTQAKQFRDALGVTGLILAKMDGTAKGGIVLTVVDELNLPIKFLGVGEKPRDLVDFQPRAFVQALFEGPPPLDREGSKKDLIR
ncbi:MAG TPA: signal recognition particle-docking protein FtsY [Armatimonadetes bacterium]|nr:signal recognition particle-docking protein FtsY [Armatimonadota bacterium]